MNYKESQKILKKIKESKNILINCHRRPDPDSVSSALAMQSLLKSIGIDSQVVSPDPIPKVMDYLENVEKIKIVNFKIFDYSKYDLFLILDSPSWDFVTGIKDDVNLPDIYKIQIDHHIKQNKFANLSLIEEEVSSTGEVLYLLLKDWGFPINKQTASALLSGMIGDTLSFKIPATSSRTLLIAAELINLGADRQDITNKLFSRMPVELLRFMGSVLHSIQYDHSGKFIWSAISHEEYSKFHNIEGAKNQTANMFFGSTMEGEFGMLMVEEQKGNLQISMRSANRFDVAEIAKELGGGGHRDSSATLIKNLPFQEAVDRVLEVARKHVKKKQKTSN